MPVEVGPSLGIVPHGVQQEAEVVVALGSSIVVRAKHPFADRQRLFVVLPRVHSRSGRVGATTSIGLDATLDDIKLDTASMP